MTVYGLMKTFREIIQDFPNPYKQATEAFLENMQEALDNSVYDLFFIKDEDITEDGFDLDLNSPTGTNLPIHLQDLKEGFYLCHLREGHEDIEVDTVIRQLEFLKNAKPDIFKNIILLPDEIRFIRARLVDDGNDMEPDMVKAPKNDDNNKPGYIVKKVNLGKATRISTVVDDDAGNTYLYSIKDNENEEKLAWVTEDGDEI